MFHGLPFGGSADLEEEALSAISSKEDLWDEIVELREKLKLMESGKMAAERKLDLVTDGQLLEGKPILVVKGVTSYEELEDLAKFWMTRAPKGAVFAIPPEAQVQDLSDKDLASVGLKRVSAGPITEQDEYNEMLLGR